MLCPLEYIYRLAQRTHCALGRLAKKKMHHNGCIFQQDKATRKRVAFRCGVVGERSFCVFTELASSITLGKTDLIYHAIYGNSRAVFGRISWVKFRLMRYIKIPH